MTTPSLSISNAEERKLIGDSSNAALFAYLDTVGDGSGTIDMSAAAALYLAKPATGEIWVIETIKIVIASAAVVEGVLFGGIAPLANGCKLEIRSGLAAAKTVSRDLTAGQPIKENNALAGMGEFQVINGTASSIVTTKIQHTLRLTGDCGDGIYFQVQDNLAALNMMYVTVSGLKYRV